MTDTALTELAPLLKGNYIPYVTLIYIEIVKKNVNDVRDALRKFRD